MSCSQALDQCDEEAKASAEEGHTYLPRRRLLVCNKEERKSRWGRNQQLFFSNKMTLEKTPLLLFLKEKKYTQRTIWRWRKKKKAEARIFVTRVRRDRWSTRIVQRMTLGVSCGTL